MEELKILQDNLSRLQERVGVMEQRMVVLEERYDNMNDLIKKNVVVLEKLDTTLQDNRVAMEHITDKIEMMDSRVSALEEDIDYVSQKVDELKDERNFNFIQWLKNNLITIIVGATVIYYLVMK